METNSTESKYGGLYLQARARADRAEALFASTGFVSPSDIHGKSIEKSVFTVPVGTSFERVQKVQDKYQLKLGKWLEKNGFIVLHMDDVEPDPAPNVNFPDRDSYCIRALVTRERPVVMNMDVPDAAVPELEAIGMKLTE